MINSVFLYGKLDKKLKNAQYRKLICPDYFDKMIKRYMSLTLLDTGPNRKTQGL